MLTYSLNRRILFRVDYIFFLPRVRLPSLSFALFQYITLFTGFTKYSLHLFLISGFKAFHHRVVSNIERLQFRILGFSGSGQYCVGEPYAVRLP